MDKEGGNTLNRKQIILYYKTNRLIKGHKAVIISLKKNIGKIYLDGQADFIMSLGKENLYFQRLSFFSKNLIPSKDFTLSLNRIKSYHLKKINMAFSCLTFYTFEKYFIQIYFCTGTPDTYDGEMNIKGIIKALTELGVKEYEYEEKNS